MRTHGDKPEVSVIIPFRNVGRHFTALLDSVATQASDVTMEVILVDNGSQDGSRAAADAFRERLDLTIIDAFERSNASYARNVGARMARADKLLFVDADDEIAPGYVGALTHALDEHDYVTSRVDSVALNPEWVRHVHGDYWQDERVSVFFGFMLATGSNIGVRRALFERVGGFPEEFSGSQDIAFCWNAQLAGATIHFVHDAVYRYRYRDTLMALYRQSRNWGFSNVLLFRTYRSRGMTRRPVSRVARDWAAVAWGLLFVWQQEARAKLVVRLGSYVGRLQGSIRYRTLYL